MSTVWPPYSFLIKCTDPRLEEYIVFFPCTYFANVRHWTESFCFVNTFPLDCVLSVFNVYMKSKNTTTTNYKKNPWKPNQHQNIKKKKIWNNSLTRQIIEKTIQSVIEKKSPVHTVSEFRWNTSSVTDIWTYGKSSVYLKQINHNYALVCWR